MEFKICSDFKPSGDQPEAISSLVNGLNEGKSDQVLLGVTGSGKTFTMANVIQTVQRPTLIIAHNKTLAAQLCAEFREFFPDNVVEYFISYYDYYQPEAYIASRDVYIEKEAEVNEEIERLRHAATRALLMRRDVIIVASVSCIYGLGMPEEYMKGVQFFKVGDEISRREMLLNLERVQYERNDVELRRGRYRVKGDTVDIFPSSDNTYVRLEFFGDELEKIREMHPVTNEVLSERTELDLYPATHYVVPADKMDMTIRNVQTELTERVKEFTDQGKLVEAQRLAQRTQYDMEMMRELGYCKGIENYSRLMDGREAGQPPGVLIDFFPDDFLTIIDESHVTVPQVKGMYKGDLSRKTALVEHGFRLPSAKDNRPLKFEEFEKRVGQVVYVSATPGPYELDKVKLDRPRGTGSRWDEYDIVEQVIRPTGLLDPVIEVRNTTHQVDHLLSEIATVVDKGGRVLITTLTKKMSEELTDFVEQKGLKVRYLHSDIVALERIEILRDLRLGKFDVLIGVNLLREGLDLPEVALVAIMDADKEGFLRNERSLIQTMGRAARNSEGRVILYADKMTQSLDLAIQETHRRREIQEAYNTEHGITPKTIVKKVSSIRDEDRELIEQIDDKAEQLTADELPGLIASLEKQMHQAAENLEFEVAAVLRDQIDRLSEKSFS